MHTPDNPDFYLKHGFDKEYADYGCPYVQENCDVQELSDNVIIYGHHMKNGLMFCDLEKFKSEDFYKEHKTISFNTLTDIRAEQSLNHQKAEVQTTARRTTQNFRQSGVRTAEQTTKTVKTVEKGAAKTAPKSVKTAEQTAKTAIKIMWLLAGQKALDHSTIARFRTGFLQDACEDLFYQMVRRLELFQRFWDVRQPMTGTQPAFRAGIIIVRLTRMLRLCT